MAQQGKTVDFGANDWFVDELYREYLADPSSVSKGWREFFDGRQPSRETPTAEAPNPAPATSSQAGERQTGENGQATEPLPKRQPAPDTNGEGQRLRGVAARIAENMADSLEVPTATSIRQVPAKLLEVNRRIINNQLARVRGGKVSFTHLIGWAVVRALLDNPPMLAHYAEVDGKPGVVRPDHLNLGLAVDVPRADGSRTLLVPNLKHAEAMDFAGFHAAYEEIIRKVKNNQLDAAMFADTTATLTNPGTVGTVGSIPRLMTGQSAIVGVGSIDYPAEYQAADPRTLAEIGVGKVIMVTSTYDHRVIQGAESGLFLRRIHQLLTGEDGFYDEIFASLEIPYEPVRWRRDTNPRIGQPPTGDGDRQIAVGRLINAYRVRGHLIANINPLSHTFHKVHPELDPATHGLTIWDLEREFATGGLAGHDRMRLGDILGVLRDAYCRTVGVEYMHIAEPDEKAWIQDRIEGIPIQLEEHDQNLILDRLNAAEVFERFLHTKYLGHKRFSLEGAEATIPMLGALLDHAADEGITEAVMGVTHRGRLNVLANVLHKSYDKIFREFEGDIDPDSVQGSGDVKYHLGARGSHDSPNGNRIDVLLSSNPSHLEAVDPVVEGMARARLDIHDWVRHIDGRSPVLPVLLHGDAAFAGQGVVAETLGLSQLRGYRTGGTIHLVINNQLGFTTAPTASRSSTYATDVAKMVQAPILHVNGDDPEACVRVMRLALDFRREFGKDVVVDLMCYRRWGHNEGDDPSYTQPLMYADIEKRVTVRQEYVAELVDRGDLTEQQAEATAEDFRQRLERALEHTREPRTTAPIEDLTPPQEMSVAPQLETGVDRELLDRVEAAVTGSDVPDDFTVHPKLLRQLDKRRDQLDRDAVDWAMGEALAFGSLICEGTPVRLTGQDTRRGTFSQRHSLLVDHHDGTEFVPLQHIAADQAPFMVYDSPLNEFAAVGFEYGYSVERPEALVCWEAQFGDFVNGAQVILDQFIASAEDKWGQASGLVLLLPHGYEGQGPEHSSARIERFLTLAAKDNMRVVQPSTSAQYFHLLRRQAHRDSHKPLVVFTPKGMLRSRDATSPGKAFERGTFQEVLGDPDAPEHVRRVLLCSGKVAHDLRKRRDADGAPAAVVRVEQLYPFPEEQMYAALQTFHGLEEVFWVQDEPENMGAWPFMHQRLHKLLRTEYQLRHISRGESASPAVGTAAIHTEQQETLLDAAFRGPW